MSWQGVEREEVFFNLTVGSQSFNEPVPLGYDFPKCFSPLSEIGKLDGG